MPYITYKIFDWDKGARPVFEALRDKKNFFFLDSSLENPAHGRFSFLGCDPFYVLRIGKAEDFSFKKLRDLFSRYKLRNNKFDFPFLGGGVGYFSYDLGAFLEGISLKNRPGLGEPCLFFGFYDTIIAVDHLKNKLTVLSTGFPEKNKFLCKKRSQARLEEFVSYVAEAKKIGKIGVRPPISNLQTIKANNKSKLEIGGLTPHSKEKYLAAVRTAKDYIRNGDIYQVNLSQRFCSKSSVGKIELYRRLRRVSPASFCAYLDCGDFQILSSSPERFLSYDGKVASVRPMKGTRARGKSSLEDRRNRQELLKSVKDKAELIMIVDLMRNDLGRVCEYGSVRVTHARMLEKYKTVYQTTAALTGRLHRLKDRFDLIRACFPGGSITGAPKIRSMQIINRLEPSARGIYTGALGYIGFNGTLDFNILIRTILKVGDKMYFHAGGGIVADSDPEKEYRETLIKAEGIFRAIRNG